MNLVIKLLVIIGGIFISHVKTTPHHCCANNGALLNLKKCEDGSDPSLTCDEHPFLLDPSLNLYFDFFIANDSKNDGKSYLDAYNAGYLIYQPYFCTAKMNSEVGDPPSNIAITCSSSRKWYSDVEVDGSEEVKTAKRNRIASIVASIFNLISAVLLLTTAAVYYKLRSVQDVQGTCYFYFSLFVGLAHFVFFYQMIFETEVLLPNMCISNTYILIYLVLCGLCWSTVSSYNIWRTTMNYNRENEAELLKNYKIYGFGLPFLMILLAWVHVHLKHMANLTFVLECFKHQIIVFEYYFSIPALLSILANFLIFIHSQIRVWSLHSVSLQDNKLTMKILKYRLFMNAKLFFIMGVPWFLFMVMIFLEVGLSHSSSFSYIIKCVTIFMILLEGIPIFVILVVFRKRVLRGIANECFVNTKIFPDKWKTAKGSETEEEVSEDETPSRSPEAKYIANTNDENENIPDNTVIVNL